MSIFAEAITGKKGAAATDEFMTNMKKGMYDSAKVLPIVAKRMKEVAMESGTLDKMSNNLDASLARLNNNWLRFISALEEVGVAGEAGNVIDQLADGIKNLTASMKENKETVEVFTKALSTLFSILFSRYAVIAASIGGFVSLAMSIQKAIEVVRALGLATALASAPLLVIVGFIAALALVVEDVYSWAKGDESILSYWIGDSSEYFIPLFDFIDNMKERWNNAVKVMTDAWDGFKSTVKKPFDIVGNWWDTGKEAASNFINSPAVEGGVNLLQPKPQATASQFTLNGVTIQANDPVALARALGQQQFVKVPQ